MAEKWNEVYKSLKAGEVYEHRTGGNINAVMVQNPDPTAIIYGHLTDVSTSRYEIKVGPRQWAVMARPHLFSKVYLLADGNISGVRIVELLTDNPLGMLQSLVSTHFGEVFITSTVGLKGSELNIEAGTKNLFTKEAPSNNIYAGRKTVTTTAAAIGTQAGREVLLQADPDNSSRLFIGSSGSQVIALDAGDAISLPIDNLNKIYAKAETGSQLINWLVRS